MPSSKRKKPIIKIEALKSWEALNNAVNISNEKQCLQLLKSEKKGRARKQFLFRIHSRYNKLRAIRERLELQDASKT